MKNIITFTLFLCLSWLMSATVALAMADIKASSRVSTNQITLGDLFDNLDKGHDIWVADAPLPGRRISIQTQYIARLTRQHGINWKNSRGLKNIVVTRESATVRYKNLKNLIKEELDMALADGQRREVRIHNGNSLIHFPEHNSLSDLRVENFTLDQASGKFSALIIAPTGFVRESRNKVTGRFYEITYVPTLSKSIPPGREILAQDIKWQPMPILKVGRNIVLSKDQIVGMTPRRPLKQSTPIRFSDLERPRLIKRGSLVRILFNSGKISLSTTGKATENGGRGDIIRVMNATSHKTIEAVVLGPNKVQVISHNSNLALLSGSN